MGADPRSRSGLWCAEGRAPCQTRPRQGLPTSAEFTLAGAAGVANDPLNREEHRKRIPAVCGECSPLPCWKQPPEEATGPGPALLCAGLPELAPTERTPTSCVESECPPERAPRAFGPADGLASTRLRFKADPSPLVDNESQDLGESAGLGQAPCLREGGSGPKRF